MLLPSVDGPTMTLSALCEQYRQCLRADPHRQAR